MMSLGKVHKINSHVTVANEPNCSPNHEITQAEKRRP